MTVKQLIAELSKLPKTYEVQTYLHFMAENPDLPVNPDEKPQALSAFLYGTLAIKDTKEVIIFGVAVPEDRAPEYGHGNN